MQEINELKNIVVQSLEANGVLSQLRAQIRASVFKIIDMQESQQKRGSCFYWENPLCQKIHEMEDGVKCLELMAEFLAFFKMDYTQSVFVHEANLKADVKRLKLIIEQLLNSEQLIEKLGMPTNKIDSSKPLLLNLLGMIKGEIGSSGVLQVEQQKKAEEKKPQQQKGQPKAQPPINDTEKLFDDLEKELQISETKQKKKVEPKAQQNKGGEIDFKQEKQSLQQAKEKLDQYSEQIQTGQLGDIQSKKNQKIEQQQQQDLKKQQQQLKEKEEQQKREKEEQIKRDKEEKAKREKEEQAKRDKEEKAKREKEEQQKREKEEQARKQKEKEQLLQKQKEQEEAQKKAEMQQFESSGDYENEGFEDMGDQSQEKLRQSQGNEMEEIDEEELMRQQQKYLAEQQEGQGQFGESEEAIGHSQGFDMSIDSQALEEYDYFEDIIPPSEFEDSQNQ